MANKDEKYNMTQEERQLKQLLLKDICARLPYGVMVFTKDFYEPCVMEAIHDNLDVQINGCLCYNLAYECKVYLRPMSSMTVEEICKIENIIGDGFTYRDGILTLSTEEVLRLPLYKVSNLLQFMCQRHLDFNNLIPMGLALEAPEGMYNI